MTVLMVEGFDAYNGVGTNTGVQAKWTVSSGVTTNSSLQTGRFGGQCLQRTGDSGNNRIWTRNIGGSPSSFTIGAAMRWTVFPASSSNTVQLGALSGSTWMIGLKIDSTGALIALRQTSLTAGTVLGTSASGVIVVNTWHYVEIEVTISDTVGVFNVWVDGTRVLNLTSVDTRNGTPTTVDTVAVCGADVNATLVVQCDDLYVTDSASRLGERRVETLYPTSDVAKGWTPDTGTTNYTQVDEAQVNGDTDYVQGSTVGDVDTYGFADLSSTPTTIDAVQVIAFAEKTDATARSIALQVKSGATTSDGSNYALTTTTYTKQERLLTTDPNTSSAWTASAVNALTGGPKVTV